MLSLTNKTPMLLSLYKTNSRAFSYNPDFNDPSRYSPLFYTSQKLLPHTNIPAILPSRLKTTASGFFLYKANGDGALTFDRRFQEFFLCTNIIAMLQFLLQMMPNVSFLSKLYFDAFLPTLLPTAPFFLFVSIFVARKLSPHLILL